EPENTRCFFRCCRGVVAHESTFTPLPEEGYWVPSHPAPRPYHTYPQAQIAVQPIHGDAAQPDASEAPAAQTPAPAAAPGQTEAAAPGRILICWVGKVDISAALRHDSINPGPIRMLLEHVPQFDHVLLLTTMNQSVLDTLRTWLSPCLPGKTLDIQRTQVTDLSDHTLVCQAAVEAVEAVIARYSLPADGTGITFHLSPGSPVTHAILLLLSTIRYHGIRLMQTRLTGLGKAPDILTVSMPDVLRGQGISLDNLPELGIGRAQPAQPAQPQATAPAPAPVQPGAATVVPAHTLLPESEYEEEQARFQSRGRTGRKNLPFPPKSKAPVRGEDLLRRFKAPARKSQPAKSSGGRAAAQTVVHEALPFELDMPLAVQDENSLRAPAANIGRPSRVSPTALQPREGDPPTISSALGAVYKKMQRVATMLLPILLLGESGSGKSRLARYLHEWSGRSGKFVSLDCAGLTDEMFAFELFGRPGASGIRPREGAFRKARSGTLFLENVNLLTPTQQSFLLRVLAPVGETKLYLPARSPFPACTVRVRIIASADNSLLSDIRAGKFRTDLYYRLAGVSTTLPSVREYSYTEREDLLRSFLVSLQHKLGQCWNFSGDAWQTLLDEKWPGNLREVSRILQQICLLS
ncbi:MAG: sigma 54-interacting transcriptional regulator, partial [Desulfovibrionaceae bacterium]|nr:sigma 54-interacting transcriptional regulator [Desulfovibrionaceae bacterium]